MIAVVDFIITLVFFFLISPNLRKKDKFLITFDISQIQFIVSAYQRISIDLKAKLSEIVVQLSESAPVHNEFNRNCA